MQLLGEGHKAEFWHPRQALVIWSDEVFSIEPEMVNASVVDRRSCCLCCLHTQTVNSNQGRHISAAAQGSCKQQKYKSSTNAHARPFVNIDCESMSHACALYLLCFKLFPFLPELICIVDCTANLQARCQTLLAINIIYLALCGVTQYLQTWTHAD